MKFKNLFVLSILFFVNHALFGQKLQDSYDFLKGESPSTRFYIHDDDEVKLVIKNINRNLWNITVNNQYKTLHREQPAIFKLFNADLSTQSEGATIPEEEVASGLESTAVTKVEVKNYFESINSLFNKSEEYLDGYNKVKKLVVLYNSLVDLSQNGTHTFAEINRSKIKFTSTYLEEYAGKTFENDVSDLVLIKELKEFMKQHFEELDKSYTVLLNSFNEFSADKAKMDGLIKSNATIGIPQSSNKFTTALEQLSLENKRLVEAIENVKKAKLSIDALVEANLASTIVKTYNGINEATFTYISPSFLAKDDLMELSVDISPKEGTIIYSNSYTNFNKTIIGVVTGFKINFSTGLFGVFGKHVFNQTYRTDQIEGDEDNNLIVQNPNKSKFVPSVGALMHFYVKKQRYINWGGALGLSVNDKVNLNYHLGLSVIMGEEQRFIISGGATLARPNLISDSYEVGGKISKTISTVPTEKFYRGGGFLGITYNLSGK